MDTPDRLEHVSQDPILSIAEDYGRITINNVWYRYEASTDCLIRCASETLTQSALFEDVSDERPS